MKISLKIKILMKAWDEFITNGYGPLFPTEKKESLSINRFQTYLVFEE